MEVSRLEGMMLTFMGWVTFLVGLLIMVQERVIRLDIGGYKVENPYYEIGITLVAVGLGLTILGVLICTYYAVKEKLSKK